MKKEEETKKAYGSGAVLKMRKRKVGEGEEMIIIIKAFKENLQKRKKLSSKKSIILSCYNGIWRRCCLYLGFIKY
jgi:hypothetical protein